MVVTPSRSDCVLLISLVYLSVDLQYQLHEFVSCHWPVHNWLAVSYVLILAFRLVHILGSGNTSTGTGSSSEDFLLNLRQKDALPRLLMSLTWLLMLPSFAVWTGLGTYWLWESKRFSSQCLPMGSMPLCFTILWLVLSYSWMLIHFTLATVAWVLERRLRLTEANLRAVEDSDTVSRWGQVSQLSGYGDLVNNSLGGLTPDQIKALPEAVASEMQLAEESECSICLNEINADDGVRQLGVCGHTFHRACIDLWLLRRADCPLCKRNVLGDTDSTSDTAGLVQV